MMIKLLRPMVLVIMNSFKKVFWDSVIILTIDYVIKSIVKYYMTLGFSIVVIKNFFNITYVQNSGGGFSVLTGHPMLLALIGLIVIDFIYYYLLKQDLNKYQVWLYAVLTGGIMGNMFDRIIYGSVIDYLDFKIFGYAFPVFNFADICITVSIFLIVLNLIKGDDHNEDSNSRRKGKTRSSLRTKDK
jgi:signal peptidase II